MNNITDSDFKYDLLKYLNDSPTAFHAVKNAVEILDRAGFRELKEQDLWELENGGKYYVTKNHSCLIAFAIGDQAVKKTGFRIIGAHTDSPNFKIKPGPCTVTEDGYVKLNTEVYGGAILSTWFDRPLAIAGRVVTEDKGTLKEELIKINRPLLMIPNLCIHFHREVNDNCSYNKQSDIFPFLMMKKENVNKADYLLDILAKEMDIKKENILDYELSLYEYERGILTGENHEFISASRIDNLAMVYTGFISLITSKTNNTKIFAAFDNEEVGSTSVQGANSHYLLHIMNRICKNFNLSDDEYFQVLAKSNSISADSAHAVHPNYGNKHDPENRPVLGGGPVIKYSAAQKYGTNAVTASYFIAACKQAGVPYQKYVNRNDIAGGSTIGPVVSSLTTIPTVDMGTPILAMHSVREFGCAIDHDYTLKAFRAYYGM